MGTTRALAGPRCEPVIWRTGPAHFPRSSSASSSTCACSEPPAPPQPRIDAMRDARGDPFGDDAALQLGLLASKSSRPSPSVAKKAFSVDDTPIAVRPFPNDRRATPASGLRPCPRPRSLRAPRLGPSSRSERRSVALRSRRGLRQAALDVPPAKRRVRCARPSPHMSRTGHRGPSSRV